MKTTYFEAFFDLAKRLPGDANYALSGNEVFKQDLKLQKLLLTPTDK